TRSGSRYRQGGAARSFPFRPPGVPQMDTVCYAHIEQNAEGEAIIAGTRIKVRMIALDRITHDWDAEEIQRHHPDLSLGQIHSALAYYYDHRESMDAEIESRHERVTT